MSYVAKINTHLGGFPLKAGEEIPAHQIEAAGQKNLEDLIAAGFVVEAGSKAIVSKDAEPSEDADAPVKPTKKKKE